MRDNFVTQCCRYTVKSDRNTVLVTMKAPESEKDIKPKYHCSYSATKMKILTHLTTLGKLKMLYISTWADCVSKIQFQCGTLDKTVDITC